MTNQCFPHNNSSKKEKLALKNNGGLFQDKTLEDDRKTNYEFQEKKVNSSKRKYNYSTLLDSLLGKM